MSTTLRPSAAACRLLSLLATLPTFAFSQSVWNGAGSDNHWSTPQNWNGDSAPLSDPATELIFAGGDGLDATADAAFSLRRLTFASGAGSFTLTGETLTFTGGLSEDSDDSYLRNDSGLAQTVGNNLALGSHTQIQALTGDLILSGAITLSAEVETAVTFSAASGRTITLTGSVAGNDGQEASLNLIGGGSFILSAGLDDSVFASIRDTGTALHFADNTTVSSGYYHFEDGTGFTLGAGATIQGGGFSYLGTPDTNTSLTFAPGMFAGNARLELENISADFSQAGIVSENVEMTLLGTTEIVASAAGAIATATDVQLFGSSALHATASAAVTVSGADPDEPAILMLADNAQLTASAAGAITADAIFAMGDSLISLHADNAITATEGLFLLADARLALNGHDLVLPALYAQSTPDAAGGIYNHGATDSTLTLAAAAANLFGGMSILDTQLGDGDGGGKLNLVVTGAATVAILRPQTYTGSTRVTGGAVLLYSDCGCDPDTLFSASPITVDGGGILAGNARLGTVTVNHGGVISPGEPSIADLSDPEAPQYLTPFDGYVTDTLRVASIAFSGDTTFVFDIYDAAGSAENLDWDHLAASGVIDLSAVSSFTLTVNFYGDDPAPALPLNFDASLPYTWNFASAGAGIVGFDASKIIVNPNYFGVGITDLPGLWSVTEENGELLLHYTPIPEPAACAFLLAAGAAFFGAARRRRLT